MRVEDLAFAESLCPLVHAVKSLSEWTCRAQFALATSPGTTIPVHGHIHNGPYIALECIYSLGVYIALGCI